MNVKEYNLRLWFINFLECELDLSGTDELEQAISWFKERFREQCESRPWYECLVTNLENVE